MNGKKIKAIVLILILLGICLGLNFVFDPFQDQIARYPSELFYNQTFYRINPDTIISSLERGGIDVFTPEVATPPIYTPAPESLQSLWGQADYLKVVSALHQFVWKESLDNWLLYSAKFDAVCRDNPSGFSSGDFIFYKTVWDQEKIRYATRELVIDPLRGEVSSAGTTNFPHPIFGWKGVNLVQIKVTADDALKMAEEDGGRAIRLSNQNACSINIGLSGYRGWYIWYEGKNGLSIYNIQIDPYTGQIIK